MGSCKWLQTRRSLMDKKAPNYNPIFGEYEAACTQTGCQGRLILEQAQSAGWRLGELIPYSPGEPVMGRCPVCKSHKMKVTRVPQPPPVKLPPGFTRIPSK